MFSPRLLLIPAALVTTFIAGSVALASSRPKAQVLKPTSVAGVMRASASKIVIDHKVWSVTQESEHTLMLKKKKKKGELADRVGLTCMCKPSSSCALLGQNSCSITRNGENASCGGGCASGSETCQWQTIAGPPIGPGSPGEVQPL
jgi:hypothetical protein